MSRCVVSVLSLQTALVIVPRKPAIPPHGAAIFPILRRPHSAGSVLSRNARSALGSTVSSQNGSCCITGGLCKPGTELTRQLCMSASRDVTTYPVHMR